MKSERRNFWKILLFALLFATLTFLNAGCASAATHYVNPGESIQAAVNAANPCDTIIVRDGTYTENVDVNKRLTIRSENGSASTIVQAAISNDYVFEVNTNHVNISGFTVKNAKNAAGIYLEATYCNISNSNCSNNHYGIYLDNSNSSTISNNTCLNNYYGIYLDNSNSSTISNNTCSNNEYGIHIFRSSDNIISNNNCSNNVWDGILLLFYSNNNIIEDNSALNNEYDGIYLGNSLNNKIRNNNALNNIVGIRLRGCLNSDIESNNANWNHAGIGLLDSSNSKIKNNSISNNSYDYGIQFYNSSNSRIEKNDANNNKGGGIRLFYSSNNSVLKNNASNNSNGIQISYSSDNNIEENTASHNNDFGIHLYSSTNNIIKSNRISNNNHGIYLRDSSDNKIENNNVSTNNEYGIYLDWSSSNNVENNTVSSNSDGIYLWYSSDNNIYLNDFINNTDNVYSYASTNIWSSIQLITYQYNDSTFTNHMGNYWDDYKGSDADGDGIGDSPHSINSDNDNYPLMELWENYFAPTENIFDTEAPANPYPSIMGTHNGTITPSHNITVSTLYTYACVGTGGHTESIELYDENDTLIANGSWNGYIGDYHNITIHNRTGEASYVTLLKNREYRYVIKTGSYPQIIHEPSKVVTGGTITCDKFIDANGRTYTDWIPAIRLYDLQNCGS